MAAAEQSGCPLCGSTPADDFAFAHGRRYRQCGVCRLVFVAPEHRLDPAAEREHYGTHQNDPADPGYRRFLNRLAEPLVERLAPGARGLDYGSGPGPALALMLREQGFSMEVFDPFFAPDPAALDRSYDFVTCTETFEHFFRPAEELERLDRLVRPGGWLGVMTEILQEDTVLERWRYARDPTHVCFYRTETMAWIAAHFGWTMQSPHRDVVLFRKPPGRGATFPAAPARHST